MRRRPTVPPRRPIVVLAAGLLLLCLPAGGPAQAAEPAPGPGTVTIRERLGDDDTVVVRFPASVPADQAGLRALVEQSIGHLAGAWSLRRWRGPAGVACWTGSVPSTEPPPH
jgi:hypothetical protein